jgi:hypothetical protein
MDEEQSKPEQQATNLSAQQACIFQQRNESRTHGTHFPALMDRNAFTFFFFFFLFLHWHDARS